MDAFIASHMHILISELVLSSSFQADYVFLEQLWSARCAACLGIVGEFKIREKLSSIMLLRRLFFSRKSSISFTVWVPFIEVQSGWLKGRFNFNNLILCFKLRQRWIPSLGGVAKRQSRGRRKSIPWRRRRCRWSRYGFWIFGLRRMKNLQKK